MSACAYTSASAGSAAPPSSILSYHSIKSTESPFYYVESLEDEIRRINCCDIARINLNLISPYRRDTERSNNVLKLCQGSGAASSSGGEMLAESPSERNIRRCTLKWKKRKIMKP